MEILLPQVFSSQDGDQHFGVRRLFRRSRYNRAAPASRRARRNSLSVPDSVKTDVPPSAGGASSANAWLASSWGQTESPGVATRLTTWRSILVIVIVLVNFMDALARLPPSLGQSGPPRT